MIFTPGDKLEYGHFTVLRELGAGGMGVVYHCRDEFLQREIAIKMLLPELMADEDTMEVFRQEARLAAQLEHPNVVTIHNIGMENREGKLHHYIAMEFLPGGSLKSRITKERMPFEQALEWMKQLTIGLNYAHKRGVVHQDIKPDNIFITHDGNLKIGDFGLALIATGIAVERVGQGKGTPAYMSPELCRGDLQDNRSDIYSLGAVFFELLTGQRPFKASGMIEMAMKHATAPVPSAHKLNSEIPVVLDKTIKKMMAKKPEERYQSLSEVLIVIEKLLLEMKVARLNIERPAKSDILETSQDLPEWLKPTDTGHQVKFNPTVHAQEWEQFQAEQASQQLLTQTPTFARGKSNDLLEQLLPNKKPPDRVAKMPDQSVSTKTSKAALSEVTDSINIDPAFQQSIKKAAAEVAAVQEKSAETSSSKNLDLLWLFKTKGPIGWASAPVISKDRKQLYIGSADGLLYALDIKRGTQVWCFASGSAIVTSPLLVSDKLFVANSSGGLYALAAIDGTKLWEYKGEDPFVATPVLYQQWLLVGSLKGSLYAFNLDDGSIQWTYKAKDAIVSSPRVLDQLIFFGSKDKFLHAVSADKGVRHWAFETEGPIVVSPLVSTDSVYVGSMDGCFYALEAERGHVIWKYKTGQPIISRGTLELSSTTVVSLDEHVYSLDKYQGKLLWQIPVPGAVMGDLVSQGTALYVAGQKGWLQCLNLKAGTLEWQADIGKRLDTTPLLLTKTIYLGSVNGEVLAYNI